MLQTLQRLQGVLHNYIDKADDPRAIIISASTAVSTPWWLPHLKSFSEAAAMFLPILGCILASVQIGVAIRKLWRK